MQKLTWTNAKGDSINLTSGNFGITNWEGFANSELNIQSQQVPFEDGSVYLDGLIENRDLSVTLALNDDGDLEKRYRLRRELIQKLNPKLGEGYLIYTNDFISKRIKCIAQIPIPENHNSNDTGTPKFSLSWTACDPYWEDLEETSVVIFPGLRTPINNEGDVPCQVKIDLFTNDVDNPEIKNFTENKKIKLNGHFPDNIEINTEFGNKKVTSKGFNFNVQNLGRQFTFIEYIEGLHQFLIQSNNVVGFSPDGMNWKYYYINESEDFSLRNVRYFSDKSLFVTVGNNGKIFTSSDGINWTSRTSGTVNNLNSICYSQELSLFVIVGNNGTILTSPDGITWTSRTSGVNFNLMSIDYSEKLDLFVAVGRSGSTGGILTSSDGITWTSGNISLTYLTGVTWVEEKELFIVEGSNNNDLYYTSISSDGINWTVGSTGLSLIYNTRICYSEQLDLFVMVCNDGKIFTSSDGINWTPQVSGTVNNLNSIIYSNDANVFIIVGSSSTILTSSDGITWDSIDINFNSVLFNVTYSENLGMFVIVGDYGCILYSTDLNEWKGKEIFSGEYEDLISVAYSEKSNILIAVGQSSAILRSDDNGKSWTSYEFNTYNNRINLVIYSEKLDLFIALSTWSENSDVVFTSSDGINWTQIEVPSVAYNDGIYSEKLGLFVTVGTRGKITTSPDGVNWTQQISGTVNNLNSICYSNKLDLFVAVGDNGTILTSPDGVNWAIRLNDNFYLRTICYSKKLGLFVTLGDVLLISSDGINWKQRNIHGINEEYLSSTNIGSITYSEDLGMFIGVGVNVYTSIDGINWLNRNVEIFTTSFISKVIYSRNLGICFVTDLFSVYISAFTETENLISNLTPDSDMTLGLQVGENELLLNRTSGDLVGRITYRQKYVGV